MKIANSKYSLIAITWLALIFLGGCSSYGLFKENMPENKAVAELNVKLGISYLALHDHEHAKQKLLLAQEKDPHNPVVWDALAIYQEKTGEMALAEKSYLRAIALVPSNGAAHNNYGVFLCNQGKYSASITQFLGAVKDPYYLHVANAYENAGICALKMKDTQSAKIFFQRASAENPNLSTSLKP